MTFHRFLGPSAAVLLVTLSGGNASAQNIATGGQPYPNRFVDGKNLGYSTRPANLTPLGISRDDCMQDMTLEFTVTLSSFTGADSVQVWGSTGSDCTAPADRGIGASGARCWGLLAGNIDGLIINTPQTYTFDVRVQDLVGWQQTPPSAASAASPPAQTSQACLAQPTPAAVPMMVNFLAVDASGNSQGTPYQYAIVTDLVAPPAPANQQLTTNGSDLLATWTPNSDADTIGYDVFFASAPAPDAQAGCSSSSSLTLLGAGGGLTVSGSKVGSYSIGAAQSDTLDAVVVSGVDALGNVTAEDSPSCDSVGNVGQGGGAPAPGASCAVGAPGEPAGPAAASVFGLLGVAWTMTRRSRRRAALQD